MDFSRVTHFLDSLKDIGIPGADLAIFIKGKEVYRHQTGVADIDTQTPIMPDTLYPIYSMTKVVTCVSALRLFEEGLFLLTDPVSEYLPEFKNMQVRHVRDNGEVYIEPARNPIRIVDLFTMSSGLTYDKTPALERMGKRKKGNYSLAEFSTAISKDPLYFEPGTHWHYGFSHDVLGYLIEVLSGKSLGEYFDENIFSPLGMTDTFFKLPEEKESRLVKCYSYNEKTKKYSAPETLPIRYDLDNKYESPGAGLISTVDDYAKFANTLCATVACACGSSAGGAITGSKGWASSVGKHPLLSKATIELMRTNHLDEARMCDYNWLHHSGYGYGLGVRTMVDKASGGSNSSIGEFGWSGLAGTFVLMDPALDLTYVYAQQLAPSKEEYVAPRLRNIIYGCLQFLSRGSKLSVKASVHR